MMALTKIKDILTIPFIKNTLKLSSSSVILMFLPLLVTPILSRLYTPADYGDWGVFSSVLFIVCSFIFLSYENTIVKTEDDSEVPNLIALCLFVMTFILIGVVIVFKIGALLKGEFFMGFPSLPLLILVIAFASLFTLFSNIGNRLKLYNAMAVTSIVNGVAQAVFRIFFGVFPIVAYGLIVGNLLAQFSAAFILLICIRRLFTNGFFKEVSWNGIKEAAVKYKKFPLFDAPARLIEFAVGNLAIIILAYFWAKDDIGCFSMVMQFVHIPITVIGSAMGTVYYKELSENVGNDIGISAATMRVAKITYVLSLLPILFLAFGGDHLFVWFLGNKWGNVAPMSLCLSLYSLPVILSEPLLSIFRSLERQEIRFRLNALNFVLSLGLLLVTSWCTHNLYISLIVYSMINAILRFILFHKELSLADLKPTLLSKWFYVVIGVCYVIALVRIIPFIAQGYYST